MGWFNYYGVIIMIIIMIPNIIYAVRTEEKNTKESIAKRSLILEQVGRYGSFIFMIFNIPFTYCDFWFAYVLIVYLLVNGVLLLIYVLGWFLLWRKSNLMKALLLSIVPTIVFVFSGVILLNIPLIICSIIFGIFHIKISIKNNSHI